MTDATATPAPPGTESGVSVRLLIVDDHAVVRQGLRMFLDLDDEIDVVGEAKDGREAVAFARKLHPDVVLMDLLMPVMDGVAATARIRQDLPEVEVVALTSVLEDAQVIRAVRAGATGYLHKNVDADDLCSAIKAAAAGRVHLSPAAAARLVREVKTPGTVDQLTPREEEVLVLLAKGQANKEIARELHIGQQTVKSYVSNILGKLDVQSRTQAALYAAQRGLVGQGEIAQGTVSPPGSSVRGGSAPASYGGDRWHRSSLVRGV